MAVHSSTPNPYFLDGRDQNAPSDLVTKLELHRLDCVGIASPIVLVSTAFVIRKKCIAFKRHVATVLQNKVFKQ